MTYKIIWKYKKMLYTEYENGEITKYIFDFLERNINNGFELVSIAPYEE